MVVVPGTWHGKFKKEWPTEEEKNILVKRNIKILNGNYIQFYTNHVVKYKVK